jgi:hypothetical protein
VVDRALTVCGDSPARGRHINHARQQRRYFRKPLFYFQYPERGETGADMRKAGKFYPLFKRSALPHSTLLCCFHFVMLQFSRAFNGALAMLSLFIRREFCVFSYSVSASAALVWGIFEDVWEVEHMLWAIWRRSEVGGLCTDLALAQC